MSVHLVPIERLRPSGANVREDLGDLTELAASIRAQGLLQPLVIGAPRDGVAMIIDGHRRYAAAKLAGVTDLLCITSAASSRDQVVTTMLAAALHKSLEPIEQANAFQALRNQGLTNGDIARRTGYSVATVSNRLLLVDLPREAQEMVKEKRLTVTDATALAKQVRASRSGSTRVAERRSTYLQRGHRLAAAAAGLCTHGEIRTIIGQVACGQCWEAAIRSDERGDSAGVMAGRLLRPGPTA